MKIKSLVSVIVPAIIFLRGSVLAQQEKKPLTNADVEQMDKEGLAETVVIAAIQSHSANYDTSPAALIELNKQGVSAKVQEAMIGANKPAQPVPATSGAEHSQQSFAVAGALYHAFLIDGTERVEMKQNKGEIDHV